MALFAEFEGVDAAVHDGWRQAGGVACGVGTGCCCIKVVGLGHGLSPRSGWVVVVGEAPMSVADGAARLTLGGDVVRRLQAAMGPTARADPFGDQVKGTPYHAPSESVRATVEV